MTNYRTVINVQDPAYGAIGNGTTDDGPAIQSAANAAAAANLPLYFPFGTYLIATVVGIPSNSRWFGDIGAIINISPTCTVSSFTIGGTCRPLYINGSSNITLEDLTFTSTGTGLAANGIAFAAINGNNINLKNCTFTGFGNSSYYAQGAIFLTCTDVTVNHCTFANNSGDGCAFSTSCSNFKFMSNTSNNNGDWGCAISYQCTNGLIENNTFIGNASCATGSDRCVDIIFTNNLCVNNAYGIRVCRFAPDSIQSQYVTIIGNIVNGATTLGISVEECTSPAGVTISGNVVVGSNGSGINVSDSCVVNVCGNTIYSTNGPSIVVASYQSSYETGRIAIVGNTCSTGTYGIEQVTGPGTISTILVSANAITAMSVAPYTLLSNAIYQQYNATNKYLDISSSINVPSSLMSSTASAGGIAMPSQVWQFLPVYIGGVQKKVPLFDP